MVQEVGDGFEKFLELYGYKGFIETNSHNRGLGFIYTDKYGKIEEISFETLVSKRLVTMKVKIGPTWFNIHNIYALVNLPKGKRSTKD